MAVFNQTPMFEEIATYLSPECDRDGCTAQPTCIRMRTNPPTGLIDGKVRTKTEWLADLWGFMEGEHEDFKRSELLVLCSPHYFEITKRPQRAKGKDLGQRNENARAKIRRFRTEAIAAYGGKCTVCGHSELTDLRLRLSPDQPDDYWAGMGLDSWQDKYTFLHESNFPEKVCQVWCIACEGNHPTVAKRTRGKLDLRTRVVRGYGGLCVGCSAEADVRTIWIVRAPKRAPLVHESGRKLNTRAKYEALIRMGFPEGWSLVCPPCYKNGVRG